MEEVMIVDDARSRNPKESPNNLFITYLERLRDKSIKRKDGRSVLLYEKALESLRKYPLPLRSVKEARKLKNIGERVAADLEKCLEKYANGETPKVVGAPTPKPKRTAEVVIDITRDDDVSCKKLRKSSSVMDTALGGVCPPPKTNLEQDKKLRKTVSAPAAALQEPPYVWSPHDRVMLIVDSRELAKKRGVRLRQELEKLNVPMREHVLGLGDMAWVISTASGGEIMLRHAVERKTVSDLSTSIKDGRYREQKHRLALAQLARVVYLIEGSIVQPAAYVDKAAWSLLSPETLEEAISSTSYGSSDFIVQRCVDVAHTARWLDQYTKRLQCLLVRHQSTAAVFAFPFGVSQVNKKDGNPTAADVFAKQLLCISGVSSKKVVAIVSKYPTLACLLEAYWELPTNSDKKALLADLPLDEGGRKLGPAASAAVYKALCAKERQN